MRVFISYNYLRILVGVSVLLLSAPIVLAETSSPQEYELKAAYLYNFLPFIEFSHKTARDEAKTYNICSFKHPKASKFLSLLDGQALGSRKIAIVYLDDEPKLDFCYVVYIPHPLRGKSSEVLQATKGKQILTIGENAGFCQQGGMLNFFVKGRKLRFEVNRTVAGQEGITFRAKMLKHAVIIH